jgi:preprotein translocase subunit SecF
MTVTISSEALAFLAGLLVGWVSLILLFAGLWRWEKRRLGRISN